MVEGEVIKSPMANPESLISPRFKSLAAMAGWDEESILIASLIVEDTPDRESKLKKRSHLNLKTPPSNPSTRNQIKSPIPISVPFINLDDEEKPETEKEKEKEKKEAEECKKQESCSKSVPPPLPCMDKLKEELSCAICLEICFEPSTTSCGHSFCKKCLRSAADKCGRRCPKCRELISNGRSCTVNTVLWNTIQLLFPKEVEERKASNNRREDPSREVEQGGPRRKRPAYSPRREVEQLSRLLNGRNRGGGTSTQSEQVERSRQRENLAWALDERGRRRRGRPSQDEDAALALRLQRQEFMGDFTLATSSSLSLARANLRAMASRANHNVRNRS